MFGVGGSTVMVDFDSDCLFDCLLDCATPTAHIIDRTSAKPLIILVLNFILRCSLKAQLYRHFESAAGFLAYYCIPASATPAKPLIIES